MKRPALFSALFFATVTVVMTWPVVTDLRHLISDPGDPLFSAWALHWDWKQTFHDPLHLFDANIFYPAKGSLAFSEHMWGIAVLGFPLFFAGVEPIAVHNILLLLGMAFSGFAAWLLVTEITGDALASVFAGILYAFVPYRFQHFSHIHLQWGGFLPLCLLFLRRYFSFRRRSDLAAFTLFFVWNSLASIQYAVTGSIALAALLVIKTTRHRLWRSRKFATAMALSMSCALVALLPFTVPYFRASRRYHMIRSLADVDYYSARWTSFLSSGWRNKLYGTLTAGFEKPECELFLGLTAMILAVLGAVYLFRPSRIVDAPPVSRKGPWNDDALWAITLVALGVVLPFGAHTFLYRALFEALPFVFRSIRVPARQVVLAHLGIGILAAYAIRFLRTRSARRRALVPVLCCVLALFEDRAAPLSLARADTGSKPYSAWLARRPVSGGVLELPMKMYDNIEYVFRSIEHGRPIANGYSSFFPADFLDLQGRFAQNPVPSDTMGRLRSMGITLVIFHPDRATSEELGSIGSFLERAKHDGDLRAAASFDDQGNTSLVFEIPSAGAASR